MKTGARVIWDDSLSIEVNNFSLILLPYIPQKNFFCTVTYLMHHSSNSIILEILKVQFWYIFLDYSQNDSKSMQETSAIKTLTWGLLVIFVVYKDLN